MCYWSRNLSRVAETTIASYPGYEAMAISVGSGCGLVIIELCEYVRELVWELINYIGEFETITVDFT